MGVAMWPLCQGRPLLLKLKAVVISEYAIQNGGVTTVEGQAMLT